MTPFEQTEDLLFHQQRHQIPLIRFFRCLQNLFRYLEDVDGLLPQKISQRLTHSTLMRRPFLGSCTDAASYTNRVNDSAERVCALAKISWFVCIFSISQRSPTRLSSQRYTQVRGHRYFLVSHPILSRFSRGGWGGGETECCLLLVRANLQQSPTGLSSGTRALSRSDFLLLHQAALSETPYLKA